MDVDEALERVESRYHPITPEAVLAAEVRRLHAVIDDWEGVEGTSGFIRALRATEGDA